VGAVKRTARAVVDALAGVAIFVCALAMGDLS
jgi:hypothetical protein